ncbi:aminotransferase class I/II-fold pyridoxal phosphate-dependent enzyme [Roseibacillus persicicus]|uniref:8-amino-7-oxononanoate synthase n=1 Tax=Roseibacillus persicicus TaxID=454148 RepID=A0A918TI22_9BACT|nr:8-amino-7-oxononanoate synthase [Roseibacillus persicicus]GHC47911.1 8-amino-7-oxononanoate synthase [Roseibacillus persicicus]
MMRSPAQELAQLQEQNLLRSLAQIEGGEVPWVTVGERRLLNFSSNDYLGLSQHPALKSAAIEATREHGTGATASRLVCGTFRYHRELEQRIAVLKETDDARLFANGYSTALGTITALVSKGDTVILDKLCHASLIDAARLSGATIRVFPHNQTERLAAILRNTREKSGSTTRILVVTESVFSMDGDTCPLAEIVALKNQYEALLLLDEAHALGVLGPRGLGLAEELGLQKQVDFQMGTLGKAAGSAGGYLAASQDWIDLLTNKARSFIYSTAPPPAQVAASQAGLDLICSSHGQKLREDLRNRIALLTSEAGLAGKLPATPIIPHILGDNELALSVSHRLRGQGLLVPAIRFPTVPRNTARLRITLSAAHSAEEISSLAAALKAFS